MAGMLALIPARGGSKRLPRKNLVEFRGRPIIAWTIEAALQVDRFDRVLVSTEDAEIAAAAAEAGAEVQPRAAEMAADGARLVDVCVQALEAERGAGRGYDRMAMLMATAPLRRAEDVRAVVDLLAPEGCDFAMAVTDYAHPPHQALRVGREGTLAPMWPDVVDKRTDEVGRLVVDNGSTYAVTVDAFLRHRTFYGPGLRGHVMPPERSVDINTPADLLLARYFADRLAT